MRYFVNLLGILLFFTQGCFISETKFLSTASANDNWNNYYAIWRGSATDTVKYAKQMGYDYINISGWLWNYYKNNTNCAGMKFYITDPQLRETLYEDLPNWGYLPDNLASGRNIVTTYSYTQPQIDWYNKYMIWKSYDSFPNNLASGYFSGTSTIFTAMWDFQQQTVIDYVVEKIVAYVKKYESQTLPFTFAGYMFDVPKLTGDFFYWKGGNKFATLTYWTGTDSGLVHGTITHEYSTYSDGFAAFYKQLMTTTRKIYPDAKWIIDPALIYDSSLSYDEYVYTVKSRTDKAELTPDMLMQEDAGTDVMATKFVDNTNNFTSGMNITKSMVGNHQRGSVGESRNRLIAAKAAINGAWYNWFGLFGGQGDMPSFGGSITNVYPRLKLVRCIPNWDNMNNVPLADRSWDGSVYQSTKGYISSDVMYSRHPKTGKLFAVFNTTNGVIRLNTGETVTSMQNTDGYFIESGDASADFDITGNEIRLKSSVTIDVDSSNGQVKGKGYIFTISSSSSTPSGSISINSGAAYTKSTNVTLNLSAMDDTGVTGYYLSTNSAVPLASATGWTAVTFTTSYSANVSYTLSSVDGAKTIYAWYKDAAGNVSGTASDSITLDTTVPSIIITSPTSNATYSTTSSTVSLGGTASDATSGVGSVTWSNSRGGSGTASGTTSWSISGITLSGGSNVITVTVTDGAGNTGTDTITVTYSNSAPTGSISINSGASYTKSTNVTLNLSATDDTGVTGYYLSTSSAAPAATATGWTAVTSTTSYSGSVSYTLSSGDGAKTLYVWYKDSGGNVSGTASDSITLDTAVPSITITSPTSNATYSTTSSTISLGGTASDATSGVSSVEWSSDKGGSGTASGTTNWSISGIALSSGNNVITVTATDGVNNIGSVTLTVTVSSTGNTSNSLQAYYTFDEGSGTTANDSSGNGNNGTINGATWTTGKIGNALNFSGTGSYVSLSNSLSSLSEFTGSAWVKVTDLTAHRGIFTSGGLNGNGFRFRINNDGSVYLLMAGGGSYDKLVTSAGTVQSGTFYHISVTGKSGQYMRIYVNGSLVKEKTTTQTVDAPTAPGYIGTSWNTSLDLMNGVIDNISIYNYVLSSQEVLKLYNNGLQAFYTFDEGSGTIANDSSGNGNNGTINGATWTTGKIGSALNFSGTGSYVSLSSILPSFSEFTASAWVKVSDLTAHRGIFTSGGLNGNGFRFRINNDGSVYLLMAGGGSYDKLVTSAGTVQSGTFYHISVTGKSGQYMRIYVNGSLVKEKTTTQTVDAPTTSGYIGTSWNASVDLMNGVIDDVRLYNSALSDQDVLDLYNASNASNGV